MITVEQTIISQYGTSATITKLIRNMNEYLDPRRTSTRFRLRLECGNRPRVLELDIWGEL